MRRVRGQSPSETTVVVAILALAALAAFTVLYPIFSRGVESFGRGRDTSTEEQLAAAGATPEDAAGALREIGGDPTGVESIASAIGPPAPAN